MVIFSVVFCLYLPASEVWAQSTPMGVDTGSGFCPLHHLNYRGADCPKCIADRSGAGKGGSGVSAENQAALAAASALGTAIGQMLRGDPQKAAKEKAAAERLVLDRQRIETANQRQLQADFNRLSSELKLDNIDGDRGGGLHLKGVDVSSNAGRTISNDPTNNELGLKLGDEGDPMVVDARNRPAEVPKELMRDAVADTPKGKVSAVSVGTIDLGRLEYDLRKRLAEATDPDVKARLQAQLGWTLEQKGDTAGAVQAINEASRLDPASPMLKLLLTAATADTREKYADAVVAAQALLKSDPGNRVAAGILAEADGKLRKLTGATAGDPIVQLVPFVHQDKPPVTSLGGSPVVDKVKAEKEFAFQGFGKQSYQAPWQEPPILDRRINLELHPELQQNFAKRDALVAQSRSATPEKAAEIKQQVQNLDKETAKQAREILKKDFPEATGL